MEQFLLAQTDSGNGNPFVLVIVIGFFLAIIGWIVYANIQNGKKREALRAYAEAAGWQYNPEEAWQRAAGANFKLVYSYNGTTDGIPWAMIFSLKNQKSPVLGRAVRPAKRNSERADRFDWRTDAVSAPSMVFIKFKAPQIMNKMLSMMGIDGNDYAQYVLSLGLTEADEQMRARMPLVIALLTKQNPLGMDEVDYGLKPIETFKAEHFELYAQSEEAAMRVLNEEALAALNAWQESFQQRFPNNAAGEITMQPMILLHQGGVYLTFEREQNDIAAVEAVVALGTGLAKSQQ